MNMKQYEVPCMDIVQVDVDTNLLVGSVIYPGDDNDPAGANEMEIE